MLLKARAVLEAVGGTLAAEPRAQRRTPMTALRAADSWLVVDGRVRAVERHWARFCAACGEHGVGPEALAAFRARVEREVPAAAAGSRASSCARTASSPSSCGRRRRASRPSWRGSPTCPIPALPAPQGSRPRPARRPARARGGPRRRRGRARRRRRAPARGRVHEPAVVGGGDAVRVPDDAPILPGITRALLIELAGERARPSRSGAPRPTELAGRETWLVSALHGIRAVTGWAGGTRPARRRARRPGSACSTTSPVPRPLSRPPRRRDRERAVHAR